MEFFKGKIGLELEAYVQGRDYLEHGGTGWVHNQALTVFQKIYKQAYLDDYKPEIPTPAYNSLEDLYNFTSDIVSQCIEKCEENNWLLSLIGCHPIGYRESGIGTFASGHIHISLKEIPTEDDAILIRRKLCSLQPFVALLSQNSPIMDLKIDNVKDVRLKYGHWSRFTPIDYLEENTHEDHYMSLSLGKNTLTLECRIPSSAPIEQIFSIVVFIKALSSLERYPILPNEIVESLYNDVIKWGGQALVPIQLPSKKEINYFALDGNKYYIPIYQLFKDFINVPEIHEAIKIVSQELPSHIRDQVSKYYSIICNGYTLSDYLINAYRHITSELTSDEINRKIEKERQNERIDDSLKDLRLRISNLVNQVTYESYKKKNPFWNMLKTPLVPEMPNIESKLSLEEAREIIKKIEIPKLDFVIPANTFDEILFLSDVSYLRNNESRKLIELFTKRDKYSGRTLTNKYGIPINVLSLFREYDIIKEEEKLDFHYPIRYGVEHITYSRGSKFHIFLQIIDKEGMR